MTEPLTAEQIADLEGKISQLPTIQKHDDDIKEIIGDLEGLKKGQKELKADVEEGFAKGRRRMDGIEGEVKEIKNIMIQSDSDRNRQHAELKEEIRNDKLKRLEDRLEKKDEEIKEKDEWQDKLKYGAMYLIGSLIIGYILWSFKTIAGG